MEGVSGRVSWEGKGGKKDGKKRSKRKRIRKCNVKLELLDCIKSCYNF